MNRIYHAKAYQVFVLLFAIPFGLSSVLEALGAADAVLRFIDLVMILIEMAWLYQLNSILGKTVGFDAMKNEMLFSRLVLALVVVNIVLYCSYLLMSVSVTGLPAMLTILASLLFTLYITRHVAMKLLKAEGRDISKKSNVITTILCFWFFPVGVWFVQPRIVRVLNNKKC